MKKDIIWLISDAVILGFIDPYSDPFLSGWRAHQDRAESDNRVGHEEKYQNI
jgi:hypothetical protein